MSVLRNLIRGRREQLSSSKSSSSSSNNTSITIASFFLGVSSSLFFILLPFDSSKLTTSAVSTTKRKIRSLIDEKNHNDTTNNINDNKVNNDYNRNHHVDKQFKQNDILPSSSTSLIQIPIRIFQPNPNLQIAYDTRTKNPIYAFEKLFVNHYNNVNNNNDQKKEKKKKRFHFHHQEQQQQHPHSIIPNYQHHLSHNSQYKHTPYDRGHLAPASDYNYNTQYKNDTFTLCNISPQYPFFNRTIWKHVEDWIRRVIGLGIIGRSSSSGSSSICQEGRVKEIEEEEDQDCIYVITGPIWLPSSISSPSTSTSHQKDVYQYSFQGIGTPPNIIHVPTHFFKVIVTLKTVNIDNYYNRDSHVAVNDKDNEDHDENMNQHSSSASSSITVVDQFAAFVLPNTNDDMNNYYHELQLKDCIVKIQDLEAVTGISFVPFHHHPRSGKKHNNDTSLEVFDLMTELIMLNSHKESLSTTTVTTPKSSSHTNTSNSLVMTTSTNHNQRGHNNTTTGNSMTTTTSNNTNTKKIKNIQKKLHRYDSRLLPRHICMDDKAPCDFILWSHNHHHRGHKKMWKRIQKFDVQ